MKKVTKFCHTFSGDDICAIIISYLREKGQEYPKPDTRADLVMIDGGLSTLTWEEVEDTIVDGNPGAP